MIGDVAEALRGEPSSRTGRELRFGRRGSLSVRLDTDQWHDTGQWHDYEAGAGGGTLDLVRHVIECDRGAALDWLASAGFVERGSGNADPTADRAGRVVLWSLEMSPKRQDKAAAAMGGDDASLHVLADPPRVYGMDPLSRQWAATAHWRPTWDAIASAGPVLVVLDTGPKVMGGVTNDAGAVIGFLGDVEREARDGGFGMLVIAHDTKAARNDAAAGDGPGAVAGSGQWFDTPRGVLHLSRGIGDDRILEAVKCSYGPDRWGVRLSPDYLNGRYAGLKLAESYTREGVEKARAAVKAARKPKRETQPKGSPGADRAAGDDGRFDDGGIL